MRLKPTLKEAGAAGLRWSGIPWIIRETKARRNASILVYHDPSPQALERHLAYLSKRYTFITLEQLVAAIRSRDWSTIPRRALVITLDDGHAGNFRLHDVFKRYGVVPTIYICSQIVATRRRFWFRAGDIPFELLTRVSNQERMEILGERYGFDVEEEHVEGPRQSLSEDEITAMNDDVDFQSHTRFHPILPACSDEECEEEIRQSKDEIERLTGKPCRHFSYPNGDYTEREMRLAERAGYLSARTVDIGWNGPDTDPFRLKIAGMVEDISTNMLAAQLSGIRYLRRLTSRGGRLDRSPRPR